YSDVSQFFSDSRHVLTQLQSIENASQKALSQNFDFTIGKNTVLAPLGGEKQITPQEGMVAKIPVLGQDTSTASVMTVSFKPDLATLSPYHGAYYAVVNSVAKAVALGVPYQETRLTLQEFFESMVNENSWGKPTAALLGAFKSMKQLGLAAIGGKDSMSGTFEDIEVPPSLISFAVATTDFTKVNSREFKSIDSKIVLLEARLNADDLLDTDEIKATFETITNLINENKVRSISTMDDKTIEMNLIEMALGNAIGFEMKAEYLHKKSALGFLVEVASDVEVEGGVIVAQSNSSDEAQFDQTYSLEELARLYAEPLADVFSDIELVSNSEDVKPALEIPEISSNAKVLIPVITGVHGEYDLYESFKR
ncbi:MAG: phosphoribosylformylglycinamidine synthase subunit PurQ, partial [Ruoffia tabacinasalis]